jgi:type I restriction-modification system DNA methylase subunit
MYNHQLFAEAYIDDLRGAKIAADVVNACQQTIREWREEFPQLEQRPALMGYLAQCFSALGFSYERRDNPGLFVLFADDARSQPLGICLAVTDENIGRMVKGRHHQVRLIKALRENNLVWGIVSNGRDWRLCWAKSPAPYEVWLEESLEELLDPHQLVGFGMFYRFFSHEAFAFREVSHQGLDGLLAESDVNTQAVERHLKNRVDEVLDALCLGFVADESGRKLGRFELDEIYRNTIYLLYRILFLFYAEARQLLPVNDEAYQAIGLEGLIESSKRWQVEGVRESDPYALWKRLTHLCVVVDDGSEQDHVNPYNGGLFSDSEKPYLRQHKIKNDFLAPALFDLAFMETHSGARRIDYRDLSIRHLGTLYEGMLEYRLNLVEGEPVVVRASKGKQVYVPQSAAGPIKKGETVLDPGRVYFADDKGERKSSGSYYTPEDVVQHIVSNTLLPKLQERIAAKLAALVEEARRERNLAVNDAQRASVESYFDRKLLELVEHELLSLKILDPAMGSAHFLVAAGQMLTNFIVETLNALDWVNETISTDPLVWKRRVVERCLYGVDVNPLAQELAKLSLWLSSAAEGKPLTFLDHHLKVGNSLYGAPLAKLASLPNAKTAQGNDDMFRLAYQHILGEVLAQLAAITGNDSERIEDVKSKGKAYHAALAQARRLHDVADVWLATLFDLIKPDGKPLDEATYFALLTESVRDYSPEAWEAYVDGQPLIMQARQIAIENRFFHWELEFPDVVVGDKCEFDVIVANPPYVGTTPSRSIKILFETARSGDLYCWIFERCLSVLGNYGNFGTIVPLSIIFAGGKKPLRELLLRQKANIHLISCDNTPDSIFGGEGYNRQRVTIALIQRTGKPTRVFSTAHLRWASQERSLLFKNLRFAETTEVCNSEYLPMIDDERLVNFLLRIRSLNHTLADITRKEAKVFLCVPSVACYFVSAVPENLQRRNQEILWFDNDDIQQFAFAILNSNVFYWYWRSRSDGFWLSRQQILSMPIPKVQNSDLVKLKELAQKLWDGAEIENSKKMGEKQVRNYYFDKRMDILLEIDDWIVRHVAPELDFPKDIFAQYKSHSFLHPLDLQMLMQIPDLGDVQMENEE